MAIFESFRIMMKKRIPKSPNPKKNQPTAGKRKYLKKTYVIIHNLSRKKDWNFQQVIFSKNAQKKVPFFEKGKKARAGHEKTSDFGHFSGIFDG